MEHQIRLRMDTVEKAARQDIAYLNMLNQMRPLEKAYNDVLRKLSSDDQNAVCDFVSQCEDMSWRMLELACSNMRLPEELNE